MAYKRFAAVLLACFLLVVVSVVADEEWEPSSRGVHPEQVHLSYGANEEQMVVTWVTMKKTPTSDCQYGKDQQPLQEVAHGSSQEYINGGIEKRVIYIHRATLERLQPGAVYKYRCGSSLGRSDVFQFTAMKAGSDWSPRFAVFGDMGDENGRSIPLLKKDVAAGLYDTILHVGDIAYDMHDNEGRVADSFMRQVEPIAANVAYQTCVGNHEYKHNFSQYDNRFSMINMADGSVNNMFYSFDIGPAHVIAFSTEYYFFVEYGWHQIGNQFRWLEADLKRANANRRERPWIITIGHRPMYCSGDNLADCTRRSSIIRTGVPLTHSYALEKLFHTYGVDLMFWGHEHNYERMLPVYDQKVYNGTDSDPYSNPGAPIHVITGSAGCKEMHCPFVEHPSDWSAFRSNDYGYTRMTIHNATHLEMEQFSVDQNAVIDHVMIRKDQHGPYADLLD